MSRPPGLLRRYALPLALLVAVVWVFVRWTLPALTDLRALEHEASALDAELEERRDAAEAKHTLRVGATDDALIRERLELDARLSPDVEGPIVVEPYEPDVDEVHVGERAADASDVR